MISSNENFKAWTGSLIFSAITIISINLISNSVESFIPTGKSEKSTVIEIIIPPEEIRHPKIIQEKRIDRVVQRKVDRAPQENPKIIERVERAPKEPVSLEQTIVEKVPVEPREIRNEGPFSKDNVSSIARTDTPVITKDVSSQLPKAPQVTKPQEIQTQQKDPLMAYFQRLKDLIRQHKRYPEEAKRRGQEGTVIVKIKITETGKIEKVEILKSSGIPALDRETLRVLKSLGTLPPPPLSKPLELNLEVEYKLGV